ncbi:hypothetical protein HDV04_001529 [Boothiomyces sp. JEL0838]|nr:hypothetical protein HDV04_001529 [Boothiomyces sp. JEL0838]
MELIEIQNSEISNYIQFDYLTFVGFLHSDLQQCKNADSGKDQVAYKLDYDAHISYTDHIPFENDAPVDIHNRYSFDDFPLFKVKPLDSIRIDPAVQQLFENYDIFESEYYFENKTRIDNDIERTREFFQLDQHQYQLDRYYIKWASKLTGFGLFSKGFIQNGQVIGYYTGVLTDDFENTDYTWLYPEKFINGKSVEIENGTTNTSFHEHLSKSSLLIYFFPHEQTDFSVPEQEHPVFDVFDLQLQTFDPHSQVFFSVPEQLQPFSEVFDLQEHTFLSPQQDFLSPQQDFSGDFPLQVHSAFSVPEQLHPLAEVFDLQEHTLEDEVHPQADFSVPEQLHPFSDVLDLQEHTFLSPQQDFLSPQQDFSGDFPLQVHSAFSVPEQLHPLAEVFDLQEHTLEDEVHPQADFSVPEQLHPFSDVLDLQVHTFDPHSHFFFSDPEQLHPFAEVLDLHQQALVAHSQVLLSFPAQSHPFVDVLDEHLHTLLLQVQVSFSFPLQLQPFADWLDGQVQTLFPQVQTVLSDPEHEQVFADLLPQLQTTSLLAVFCFLG